MKNNKPKYSFLIAQQNIHARETIFSLVNKTTNQKDPRRIQIDENLFILPPTCIYHSCSPNAYIDWDTLELKALKTIKRGETVTYHYGSSEYDYSVGAFHCSCGSKNCIGYFSGFMNMSQSQQKAIIEWVSPFIKDKYKNP